MLNFHQIKVKIKNETGVFPSGKKNGGIAPIWAKLLSFFVAKALN